MGSSAQQNQSQHLLIAMKTEKRGESMAPLAKSLRLNYKVTANAEDLLVNIRHTVPRALLIEDDFIASVQEHDLIALLRRRESLATIPIVVLGKGGSSRQMELINSGADIYLTLPIKPVLLQTYIKHLLTKQSSQNVLQQELTKLRDIEKDYKESERIKEDLTHMLIHDLKSPIASVMGLLDHSVDMLKAEGKENSAAQDDVLELLTLATNESQHLLTLASNILDVRRMREGHMPYNPEWIEDLGDLVQKALYDATGNPSDRNFDVIITPEAKRIFADQGLLRRVITNLLSNAIKHTRRDGYIDFRAWREGEAYLLSVRDNGEGIPEGDQRRIFNAFEQSRHTVHDRYDTGMGLTFCKMAVEKHGGEIWVESKMGRGSTFYIKIPTQPDETIIL